VALVFVLRVRLGVVVCASRLCWRHFAFEL
jgi:hypothetical protein